MSIENQSREQMPVAEAESTDETDPEKIQQLFVEAPSEHVELLANHLMRPDGFAKTLISGSIVSSAELQEKIGEEFVKTHRGFYMSHPPSRRGGGNDYLSFNVGKAQRLYQDGSRWKLKGGWENGLGFVTPAKELLNCSTVEPSWGCLDLRSIIEKTKDNPTLALALKKYSALSPNRLWDIEQKPSKEDLLFLVDTARKVGNLTGGDQAEVNMRKDGDEYPRLSLEEMVTLIPAAQRRVFERYLHKKLHDIEPYEKKINDTFGVSLSNVDEHTILGHRNIYWYPQENIELAVEYLTTHPERLHEFLGK